MHITEINQFVEVVRYCLSLGQPVKYSFIRNGVRLNGNSHVIRNTDELATLRASLMLREAVEGDDDAPEDYS